MGVKNGPSEKVWAGGPFLQMNVWGKEVGADLKVRAFWHESSGNGREDETRSLWVGHFK